MAPAVRAIIQIPYRGRGGERPGTLLTLEKNRSRGYQYLLPGGSLEPRDLVPGMNPDERDWARKSRLQKELREELSIDVSRLHLQLLTKMDTGTRDNYIYLVRHIRDGTHFRLDGREVIGIGVDHASEPIRDSLRTGHLAYIDEFYGTYPHEASDMRRSLLIPSGYFNPDALARDIRNGIIPSTVIDWETQRKKWLTWETEKRGIPPLNIS